MIAETSFSPQDWNLGLKAMGRPVKSITPHEQFIIDRYLLTAWPARLGEETFNFKGYKCRVTERHIQDAAAILSSRLKEYLPMSPQAYVAGGSAAEIFLYGNFDKTKDIDIWPISEHENKRIQKHLEKKLSDKGYSVITNPHSKSYRFDDIQIDVVDFKFYSKLSDLLSIFDFNVTRFGFVIHENYRFEKQCTWEELFTMRLDFKKDFISEEKGVGMVQRLMRYAKKGYTISQEKIIYFICKITTKTQEEFEAKYKEAAKNILDYQLDTEIFTDKF